MVAQELIKPLVSLLIGGVLGGLITTYYNLRKQIVLDIWQERFIQYKKLWSLSGVISKWPKNDKITYGSLYKLSLELKNWYFNDGGLLFSKKSRNCYEDLQELISKHIRVDATETLSNEVYDLIRQAFSALRTQMTEDMSSRNRKLLN